jgi:protein TonB
VRQYDGVLRQPQAIPEHVAIIDEPEAGEWAPPQIGVPGGVPCPGCTTTGVIGSIVTAGPAVPLPPAPPVVKPAAAVVPDTPIQVVSDLQAAKLIHKVTPVYPELAKRARITGVVSIEAIIAKDGAMRSVRVLGGHPLLINAAVDAVKQWRYRPTLLQGQPVEVITRIEVNFTLR